MPGHVCCALSVQSYTKKLVAHQTAYASASSQASARLAQIDAALKESDAAVALQNLSDVTVTEETDGLQIDYTVPVTDSQQLEVTILADPDNHSRRILRWKEAATSDWEAQTTLPVIGSDQ